MKRLEKIRYQPKRIPAPFTGISRDSAFYNSSHWRKVRTAHIKANPICVSCGKAGQVVDHIKPIDATDAYSGIDPLMLSNLQTMCHRCHNSKSGQKKK